MEATEKTDVIFPETGMEQTLTISKSDIHKIENGQLIGLIVDETDFMMIYPSIYVGIDGELLYDMGVDDKIGINQADETLKKHIPLIVQKIDDDKVKDLLSGEVFNIGSFDYFASKTDTDGDIESFQQVSEKYKNDNVCIEARVRNQDTKEYEDSFFIIDDAFKKIYGEITIPNKDAIVSSLKDLKTKANRVFIKCYNNGIDMIQGIANTENMIRDFEENNKMKM